MILKFISIFSLSISHPLFDLLHSCAVALLLISKLREESEKDREFRITHMASGYCAFLHGVSVYVWNAGHINLKLIRSLAHSTALSIDFHFKEVILCEFRTCDCAFVCHCVRALCGLHMISVCGNTCKAHGGELHSRCESCVYALANGVPALITKWIRRNLSD